MSRKLLADQRRLAALGFEPWSRSKLGHYLALAYDVSGAPVKII